MGTVYGEIVEVGLDATNPDARPQSFRWRGRRYVVAEVLSHWQERSSWWRSPAARAVHGDVQGLDAQVRAPLTSGSDPAGLDPAGLDPAGLDPAGLDPADSGVRGTQAVLLAGREVWRVEARAGERLSLGVYDLCRESEHAPTGPVDRWRLLRVAD